jgi:hypothetical protein
MTPQLVVTFGASKMAPLRKFRAEHHEFTMLAFAFETHSPNRPDSSATQSTGFVRQFPKNSLVRILVNCDRRKLRVTISHRKLGSTGIPSRLDQQFDRF